MRYLHFPRYISLVLFFYEQWKSIGFTKDQRCGTQIGIQFMFRNIVDIWVIMLQIGIVCGIYLVSSHMQIANKYTTTVYP